MDYQRLRAEYDAAFDRLRRADSELRSIRQQPSPDQAAERAARQRFDQAMVVYRACRDRLAELLVCRRLGGVLALSMGEVRVLAPRLWEEAGPPIGNPDEHWCRAEEMLGSGEYRAV